MTLTSALQRKNSFDLDTALSSAEYGKNCEKYSCVLLLPVGYVQVLRAMPWPGATCYLLNSALSKRKRLQCGLVVIIYFNLHPSETLPHPTAEAQLLPLQWDGEGFQKDAS